MKPTFDFFEIIYDKIEDKKYFIIILLVLNLTTIYYQFSFLKENILYSVLLLLINFIIITTWRVWTNRFIFYKKNKIVLGVFIKCDDDTSHKEIKKILKSLKHEIKNDIEGFEIIIFPLNFKTSDDEIEKFIFDKEYAFDVAVLLDLHYGNEKINGSSEQKISIKNIKNFGIYPKKILGIENELKALSIHIEVRKIDKNFEYIKSNSFNDKLKLNNNLKDIFVFQAGLYAVLNNNFEISLNCLDFLYRIQESMNSRSNEFLKVILKKIYTHHSVTEYIFNNKSNEAYNLLKRYFELFDDNDFYTITNCTNFSRLCFELDKYEEAKFYTEKISKIKSDIGVVHINRAFFSIIENNKNDLIKYLTPLANTSKYEKQNYVVVIEFLEKYKKKYSDRLYLFNTAIGFYNYYYVDKHLGLGELNTILKEVGSNEEFDELVVFINLILKNKLFRGSYYHRKKDKKAA